MQYIYNYYMQLFSTTHTSGVYVLSEQEQPGKGQFVWNLKLCPNQPKMYNWERFLSRYPASDKHFPCVFSTYAVPHNVCRVNEIYSQMIDLSMSVVRLL